MSESNMTRLARERALYQYSMALERGDFETISQILHAAEEDGELERMIAEAHEAYELEIDTTAHWEAAAQIAALLREHLPTGLPTEEIELPPLTVGDVVARIQADTALKGTADRETPATIGRLRIDPTPLPLELGQRRVRQIFQQIGVAVSHSFEKLFRETAIFLSMGREQGQARLAATQRQRRRSSATGQQDKEKKQ